MCSKYVCLLFFFFVYIKWELGNSSVLCKFTVFLWFFFFFEKSSTPQNKYSEFCKVFTFSKWSSCFFDLKQDFFFPSKCTLTRCSKSRQTILYQMKCFFLFEIISIFILQNIFLIDLKCSFWNCKWNQSVQEEKLKFALIKIALILLWDEAAKCPLICRLNCRRASSVFNRLTLNSWIKPQIVQSNVEPTSESSHKTIRFHLSLGSSGSTG